jgi:mono/diheme cytochrome c family protein
MGCSEYNLRHMVRRQTWQTSSAATVFFGTAGCLAIVAGAVHAATAQETAEPPARLSFNADIRPILSENCFACHGPDHANRQAGLRLDSFDQATEELDSGERAIVPEDVEASELIARVASTDPDLVMPPPEAKIGRLSPEQVAKLRRWIAEGAKYEPHWAFVSPVKPEVVEVVDGVLPIDRIVEPKLAVRGLALQPEADRVTLIRRASFDITGLPPTPEEVAAFVADTSPSAYEKLLDRLLASPRYGERMATDWMDLARYSDSYGFQVDRPRPTMWPWRDWVIKAFNENLPWDRFTLWQVAGDLLPHATDEQRLATAFNRLHQQESEGGSVEEEYRVNYVNDRVTTFGTAFLGLTLECCRCHDHKFDPLSQKEFYSLFAFFDDIDEAGLYSYFTPAVPTPKLRLLDDKTVTALAKSGEACGEAAAELAAAEAGVRGRVADWCAGRDDVPLGVAAAAQTGGGTLPGELVRYTFDERSADGTFANSAAAGAADQSARSPADNTLAPGRLGQAIRLTGDHPVSTPVGNFRRSQPFTVALWLKSPEAFARAVVFHRSKAWTDAASRGYELLVDEGHLRWSLIHFWPGDAASVRMREPLPVDEWVHVAVSSDGSGTAAGLTMFVNGRPVATTVVRDSLTREITGGGGDTITIGERMRDHGFKGGLVDEFRVFDRALAPLEVQELVEPGTIRALVATRGTPAAPAELVEELAAVEASGFDETVAAARQALRTARQARDDLAERPAEIMVMQDLPQPKMAYVLERGDYDKRGELVEPVTPAVLPPFPADQPRNRLGLATWLVDPDHPLLARVTVNRLWQALFGLGLVQSPEDLGSQATRPEYPELLDLLAWRFSHPVADGGLGWDMKALVKTIMLSRTYRQRSIADFKTMADDPLNVWLARGPRHRLPAEMIRDGALQACGLLVEQVGGPPVKTYDMPDSFKPEKADAGNALYRRSLYTYWRRTGPAPVLEVFDVPKRVVCVAKRDTTNTPLHAFVLMNGPQFVEAARVLAERLLAETGGRAEETLDRGFALLTSRAPDAEESRIVHRMHAEQLAWYRNRPDEATKLVAVGARPPATGLDAVDVAAAAAVLNTLMNYDGSVVKR